MDTHGAEEWHYLTWFLSGLLWLLAENKLKWVRAEAGRTFRRLWCRNPDGRWWWLEPGWLQRMLVELWIYFEGRTENCLWSKETKRGTFLAVQWLRLCTSTAGVTGLIPGQGTKIPHAVQCSWKKKKEKERKRERSKTTPRILGLSSRKAGDVIHWAAEDNERRIHLESVKFEMPITCPSENIEETNIMPGFTNINPFNPRNNPWDREHSWPHFTGEDWDSERMSDLPKVTKPGGSGTGQLGFKPKPWGAECMLFYTILPLSWENTHTHTHTSLIPIT